MSFWRDDSLYFDEFIPSKVSAALPGHTRRAGDGCPSA